MKIKQKIAIMLIGLAVFGFVVAPQPARAFSWGDFGSAVVSLPQTIANWFGGLFSDIFGKKNAKPVSEPAIQPPVESIAPAVESNPEIDEKSCQQDSDCVIVSVRDEKDKCCDECGEEAINRNADRNRRVWREINCLDKENHLCLKLDCQEQPSNQVCVDNKCVLRPIEKTAKCGDGKCEENENCAADCKAESGKACNNNGICDKGETANECVDCANKLKCAADADCVETCGFGECVSQGWHKWINCGFGSGATCYCNNGTCSKKEESKVVCGNGYCNATETVENCPADCKTPTVYTPLCNNNGVCETGEKGGYACEKDCVCGDGLCDPGESIVTCEKDCSNFCLGEGQIAYSYDKSSNINFWSGRGCCKEFALVGADNGAYMCTKVNCVSEPGKEVSTSDGHYSGCCAGLKQNWMPFGGTPSYTCTVCGNGSCDKGETSENCKQDCVCAKLNESPTAGSLCCSGLAQANNYYQIDSQGKCVPKTDMAGVKAVCVACGNGKCEINEDKCNCPKDCGNPVASCGNNICDSGETMGSCPIDCEPKAGKPVIYLYPQKTQAINVKVDFDGKIIADYPDYNPLTGWNVVACPDGRLVNQADGKEYSYLFWEGGNFGADYDLSRGFVVKGSETKQFLQDILPKIGLTPKEYNEFIVYWYPKMKGNPYNLIHFAAEEYTSRARLEITPKPDSILRVFMVFKPLQAKINITPQTFAPFVRTGFTVVEWGGSEIK